MKYLISLALFTFAFIACDDDDSSSTTNRPDKGEITFKVGGDLDFEFTSDYVTWSGVLDSAFEEIDDINLYRYTSYSVTAVMEDGDMEYEFTFNSYEESPNFYVKKNGQTQHHFIKEFGEQNIGVPYWTKEAESVRTNFSMNMLRKSQNSSANSISISGGEILLK